MKTSESCANARGKSLPEILVARILPVTERLRNSSSLTAERSLRFLIENRHRFGEQRIGLFSVIADGGQTDAPVRAKRAHHVKDNARLARLIEVNVVTRDNVE